MSLWNLIKNTIKSVCGLSLIVALFSFILAAPIYWLWPFSAGVVVGGMPDYMTCVLCLVMLSTVFVTVVIGYLVLYAAVQALVESILLDQ